MNNPYQYLEEYTCKEILYKDFCELANLEPLKDMQKNRQLKELGAYMDIRSKYGKIIINKLYNQDKIRLKVKSYHRGTATKFNIKPKDKNKSGVYKIQLDNTIYIGQTNNFIERYYQHNAKLNKMNKLTKPLLDSGASMEVLEFEDDLEKRLLKESKYAIEYKLMGFNVINNFNRIVKENYSKNSKEKFVIIKLKLKDLDFALKLLCDNNITVERKTKNNV